MMYQIIYSHQRAEKKNVSAPIRTSMNDFITLTTPSDLKQLNSTAASILIHFPIY